jgi:hypothetical protein
MKYELFIFAVVISFSQNSIASTACPLELSGVSQTLEQPLVGWEAYIGPVKLKLSGVEVSDKRPDKGEPEIYSIEKSYKDSSGRDVSEYQWSLREIKDPWLECTYSSTSIRLIRSLAELQVCTMKQIRNSKTAPYRLVSVECK